MEHSFEPADAGPDSDVVVDASLPPPDTRPAPDPDASRPPPENVLVYAHSAVTLFAFDPTDLSVETVGDFTLPSGDPAPVMTDLAVTDEGVIYTCGHGALYTVDPESAVVEEVALFNLPDGAAFNGLTFLPAGTLDDDRETLVGDTDTGEFYEVDTETGETHLLGTYSNGYVSSGDIVSVEGAGTYATVKRDDLETDILVRVNPRTGQATRIGDGIGFKRIFGLGYFRSRLYGFVSDGTLIEIDIETGVGEPVATNTGTEQFWGAGVTTLAPTGPF